MFFREVADYPPYEEPLDARIADLLERALPARCDRSFLDARVRRGLPRQFKSPVEGVTLEEILQLVRLRVVDLKMDSEHPTSRYRGEDWLQYNRDAYRETLVRVLRMDAAEREALKAMAAIARDPRR